MADQYGNSGPFNPAIGLGTAQTDVVIGVAAGTTALQAAVTAGSWQQAAAGNFIGVQSAATTSYAQAQGDTPADFGATFDARRVDNASTLGDSSYQRVSAGQYKFGTAVPAPASLTFVAGASAPAATGVVMTATVKDQFGAAISGATVNFTLAGGTATGQALSSATGTTNGSGVATVTVTGTAAGTAIVQAQVANTAPVSATATLT